MGNLNNEPIKYKSSPQSNHYINYQKHHNSTKCTKMRKYSSSQQPSCKTNKSSSKTNKSSSKKRKIFTQECKTSSKSSKYKLIFNPYIIKI